MSTLQLLFKSSMIPLNTCVLHPTIYSVYHNSCSWQPIFSPFPLESWMPATLQSQKDPTMTWSYLIFMTPSPLLHTMSFLYNYSSKGTLCSSPLLPHHGFTDSPTLATSPPIWGTSLYRWMQLWKSHSWCLVWHYIHEYELEMRA